MTRDIEKAVFTSQTCPLASQVAEAPSRVCGSEAALTAEEDRAQDHLTHLDIHKCMGLDRMHLKMLKVLPGRSHCEVAITFKK